MNEAMLLVLDEGTTSTRAMLYTPDGVRVGTAQRDLTQYYPRPGWVEQDATEIWERTLACAQEMVAQAGGADRILAIGITNQRETVVAWDRRSGRPLARATASNRSRLKLSQPSDTITSPPTLGWVAIASITLAA